MGSFKISPFWLPFVGTGDPGGCRTGLVWGAEHHREATEVHPEVRSTKGSTVPFTATSKPAPMAGERPGLAPPRPTSSGRGAGRTIADARTTHPHSEHHGVRPQSCASLISHRADPRTEAGPAPQQTPWHLDGCHRNAPAPTLRCGLLGKQSHHRQHLPSPHQGPTLC